MKGISTSILITGGAGFIGSHVSRKLIETGYRVTVLDNLDPFYDPAIKRRNMEDLLAHGLFTFLEGDIRETDWQEQIRETPDAIIHLAAKAGVRPSISNPKEYIDVNVNGTLSILEFARHREIKRIIFGSSSSVYGINPHVPWKESDTDLQPISPYAQSKVAAEQLCRVYAHLYDLDIAALRFFTVYGPGQRPDLAIHSFFSKILEGKPIQLYGDGSTGRDYTYVGDIVNGVIAVLSFKKHNGFNIFNLGNNQTVELKELVKQIEATVGKQAKIEQLTEQPGDVPLTCANIEKAQKLLGYEPVTELEEGLCSFFKWMKEVSGVVSTEA